MKRAIFCLLCAVLFNGCAYVSTTARSMPAKVVSVCPECGRTNIVRTNQQKVTARAYVLFTKADAVVKMVRVVAAQSGSVAVGVTDVNASSDAQVAASLQAVVTILGPILKLAGLIP